MTNCTAIRRIVATNLKIGSHFLMTAGGMTMILRLLVGFILAILQFTPSSVSAADVCSIVSGAVIIAQDDANTYLGKIASAYDGESIFNEYGTYGSQYSSTSIWNQYGTFGSEYSAYSPFNKYTSTPPMIVKSRQIIGYLSANKSTPSSIAPNLLKALCKDEP